MKPIIYLKEENERKIIIFLTGLLLGAIISTGPIYIYTIANGKSVNEMGMPSDRGQGMMEIRRKYQMMREMP